MKKNNNLYKLILPLLIVAIFPLSGLCADDFYTDDSAAEKMMQAAGEETPEKAERVIKDIEVHGLNVISPETVLEKITLKKGDKFDRNVVQNDLRTIYQMGYFTEKMRALPVNNPDGTVTLKLILEENSPVTDFTIEGNTVVSTEEILNTLMDMKGKPQNIAQLNQAIVEIQDIYNSKVLLLNF